jgi:hypothetical protein
MEFLTNDICTFQILEKEKLLTHGVNILVSVFFKRDQYYKNFGIYVKGLQKVLHFVDKQNDKNKFIFVLFIDQNIADDEKIMSSIKRCKNCVPVLFKCVKYMDEKYHYDLFGSLVRFFPMFAFPNNPCDIVICIDIDLHTEDYGRLESVMRHKFKGITGAGDISKVLYDNLKPYTYANLLCFNDKKNDPSMIINFIRDAGEGKIKSKGHYGKRLTNFGFGVDEIFLNDVMIENMGTINTIIEYQISYLMFHSKSFLLQEDRIKKTSDILDTILGPYAKADMTVNQKMDFIDKNTYQVRERTKINNEICIRFTKVIDHLVDAKKIWMQSNVQQFIHKYLRHVISANLVVQTNYKHGVTITDAVAYDTIYDTEYEIEQNSDESK